MAGILNGITELVGNTPLMEAVNLEKKEGLKARLLLKLEYLNPAGSVKDRVAKAMIEDAEAKGLLKEGSVIIEPTSGNTGIGLAAIAASKGYQVILTMPDTMSEERRNILKAYGAKLVLTPGAKGMSGAIEKAEELAKEIPQSMIAGQFVNPVNPKAHRESTGPEIWRDTEGQVDIFVASVGTGGTITGTGGYLKEKNPHIQVIAVEPAASPVLSGGAAGAHKIQGSERDLCRRCWIQRYMMRSLPWIMKFPLKQPVCWLKQRESRRVFLPAQRCMQPYRLPSGLKMKEKPLLYCCRTAETGIILRRFFRQVNNTRHWETAVI